MSFGDDFMQFLITLLLVVLLLGGVILLLSYVCFRMAFYAPNRTAAQCESEDYPDGEIYEPFLECMKQYTKETKAIPFEEFSITSFDGLKLVGKYYEYKKGAPIELMFHGYRGSAQRDLSGAVQRCFELHTSALIVEQRCSKKSEGNVITFGIFEHRDCLSWVDFMIKHFGEDVRILLTGISMGASTVLTATGKELPKNVIGVIADCGFSSPKDIIKKVIKQMGLPVGLGYFFVKLGARIYGGFDLEETSAETALKNCTVPVLFFHGEDDDYVPCEMSKINFNACNSKKMLVTMKGAGHGLCYLVDKEKYMNSVREFFGSHPQ